MLAGLRSGQLPEVLEEYVDLEHSQADLRRRLWSSLLYPFVLLAVLTALVVLSRVFIIDGFISMFRDFKARLPMMTEWFIASSWPMMWGMVALLCLMALVPTLLAAAPHARWLWPVLYKIPMIGPVLRWGHLAQFGRLMGLLLGQQVPLPDALQLTSEGLRDGNLASACRRVADEVGQRPRPLPEPGRPAAVSAEHDSGDRMGAARRLCPTPSTPSPKCSRAECARKAPCLEAILLPVMLLFIIAFAGVFIVAMMLPMISLIQ